MTPGDDEKPLGDVLSKFRGPLPDHLRGKPEREDPEEAVRRRMTHLGIPKAYRSAHLSDFEPADFSVGAEILGWETLEKDLLIIGANGRGKSHLLAALAIKFDCIWLSTLLFLPRLRRTFSPKSEESEWDLVLSQISPAKLAIDDITAIQLTDYALTTILAIVNGRLESCRRTLVTSFHSFEEVTEFDSSLASRLGGFKVVKLTGPDRRIKKPNFPKSAGPAPREAPPESPGASSWNF